MDAKLYELLVALNIPEIGGTRVYADAAIQGAAKPYLVYGLLGKLPMLTQDLQSTGETTRQWRYQFAATGTDRIQCTSIVQQAVQGLVKRASDRPGLQRTIELSERSGWVELERFYVVFADVDIIENLA